MTIRQRSTGVSHGIIVLPKSRGYLLLRGGDPASADSFWVDMNFDLVRSVRTVAQGGIASIPSETRDAELAQEIAFWAMVADSDQVAVLSRWRRLRRHDDLAECAGPDAAPLSAPHPFPAHSTQFILHRQTAA